MVVGIELSALPASAVGLVEFGLQGTRVSRTCRLRDGQLRVQARDLLVRRLHVLQLRLRFVAQVVERVFLVVDGHCLAVGHGWSLYRGRVGRQVSWGRLHKVCGANKKGAATRAAPVFSAPCGEDLGEVAVNEAIGSNIVEGTDEINVASGDICVGISIGRALNNFIEVGVPAAVERNKSLVCVSTH